MSVDMRRIRLADEGMKTDDGCPRAVECPVHTEFGKKNDRLRGGEKRR